MRELSIQWVAVAHLCSAVISNGFWHPIPLILLNPFVSQKQFITWCKQTVKELR